MWLTILLLSVVYFAALVAALFLILALQIFLRALNLNEHLWRTFPHTLFLEPSGKPRFGFRRRLAVFLGGSYVTILLVLALIVRP